MKISTNYNQPRSVVKTSSIKKTVKAVPNSTSSMINTAPLNFFYNASNIEFCGKKPEFSKNLSKLREFMQKEDLDFLIVNSTDEYLNEYNHLNQSSRYLISGFSGSTGDILLTKEKAYLFVDNRYHKQADDEVDHDKIKVIKIDGYDIAGGINAALDHLAKNEDNIGITSSKISVSDYMNLIETLPENTNVTVLEEDPLFQIIATPKNKIQNVSLLPISIAGESAISKVEKVRQIMNKEELDGLMLTEPASIAYLLNLRSDEIICSSAFKAKALITKDKCSVFCDLRKIPTAVQKTFPAQFEFMEENNLLNYLQNQDSIRKIGYIPQTTTLNTYINLANSGAELIGTEDPITTLKSVKNESELNHIRSAFKRTDKAVESAINWLNTNIKKGKKISEKEFSEKVLECFKKNGAKSISFETIAGSGKNTAIVHYTNPSSSKYIKPGELVLLDCGGYFEGGYATDITRTFLAGGDKTKASPEMKTTYTRVLKGCINAINMPITENTSGYDVDNMARKYATEDLREGFSFPHPVGHGVGIPVHEGPPYINNTEYSKAPLQPGMVFTIEPGIYNDDWGGVRLENTVELTKENGKLKIKSLCKAKFDKNLIDFSLLSDKEKEWLKEYLD